MTIRLVTASERQRARVTKVLNEALEEAAAGRLANVLVIAWRDDGSWMEFLSEQPSASELVGKLEIIKQVALRRYFRASGEETNP